MAYRSTLAAVALLTALFIVIGPALASPEGDVQTLDQSADRAFSAAQAGDIAGARSAYAEFDRGWLDVEDGVRSRSRTSYRAIESAMSDVKVALAIQPEDPKRVAEALLVLKKRDQEFLAAGPGPTEVPASSQSDTSLVGLLRQSLGNLERADAAAQRGDAQAATTEVRTFQTRWPEFEGLVRAKAPAVYSHTENSTAEIYADLSSTPPNLVRAHELLAITRQQLEPLAVEGASYGVFDAAVILLREGLEALLVVAALLAFLRKAGRPDQERWIWAGGAVGVGLSVVVAIAAQAAFSRAGAALGSELIEGAIGLLAAVMLFYVSYWLHQKSQLGAWHQYVQARSTVALARNSVLSLATIAFLAVFREGAETAVFYLGVAPSISLVDLLLGIGLGAGLLALVGIALLTLGLRLPLRPFFLASSFLIYYLGFKFVGTGLHALQVAGVLPATPGPLPAIDVLGVFPTWQTTLPQLALLVMALGIAIYSLRRPASRPATAA